MARKRDKDKKVESVSAVQGLESRTNAENVLRTTRYCNFGSGRSVVSLDFLCCHATFSFKFSLSDFTGRWEKEF